MGKHHKTTEQQREQILRRYKGGETIRTIARDYRITVAAVGYYARQAGAPRRRKPAARKHRT